MLEINKNYIALEGQFAFSIDDLIPDTLAMVIDGIGGITISASKENIEKLQSNLNKIKNSERIIKKGFSYTVTYLERDENNNISYIELLENDTKKEVAMGTIIENLFSIQE